MLPLYSVLEQFMEFYNIFFACEDGPFGCCFGCLICWCGKVSMFESFDNSDHFYARCCVECCSWVLFLLFLSLRTLEMYVAH
jgi:hypothetical protein